MLIIAEGLDKYCLIRLAGNAGNRVLTCRWIESNFANFVTRSDRSPRGDETDKVEPIIRQVAIASQKSALRKNVSDRAQVVSHCGA